MRQTTPRASCWVFLGLLHLNCNSGVAYIRAPEEESCTGPSCEQTCDQSAEFTCPEGSFCGADGHCVTDPSWLSEPELKPKENPSVPTTAPDTLGETNTNNPDHTNPDDNNNQGNDNTDPTSTSTPTSTPTCLTPNACGNCYPDCRIEPLGQGGANALPDPVVGSGILKTPEGVITLGVTTSTTDYAFPSNSGEGTITKIDTLLGREVARYATVLRQNATGSACNECAVWNSGVNLPSRSTVDPKTGSAFIANRGHKGGCPSSGGNCWGSVSKIAFYDKTACDPYDATRCLCVDKNKNGKIDTSKDCGGLGITDQGLCPNGSTPDGISINEADGEFLGEADECIIWTKRLGNNAGANPRAMALDSLGFVWVGLYAEKRFLKLNPLDGALIDPDGPNGSATAESGVQLTSGGQPYGAVIDRNGILSYVHTSDSGAIQRINTHTGILESQQFITGNPARGYGITVDSEKRVWLASYSDVAQGGTVARYDPNEPDPSKRWRTFSAGLTGTWGGRGLTATGRDVTGKGQVWATFHNSAKNSYVVGFDEDTGEVVTSGNSALRVNLTDQEPPAGYNKCAAKTALGVGIGPEKSVWVVNHGSSNICKYDTQSGALFGITIGRTPYTYSDFTGNIFNTFTTSGGTYTVAFPGCGTGFITHWAHVRWDAEIPGVSAVSVVARSATNPSGLKGSVSVDGPTSVTGTNMWVEPPVRGDIVELQFQLSADPAKPGVVPKLLGVSVAKNCYVME